MMLSCNGGLEPASLVKGVEGLAALEKEYEETIPPKKNSCPAKKSGTYSKCLSQIDH